MILVSEIIDALPKIPHPLSSAHNDLAVHLGKMADVAESPMELEGSPSQAYYKIELNKTLWEVPSKYQELTPIGTGAYGSVW